MTETLISWNEGAARRAIIEFVERTVSGAVPLDERVAVFDNDGTLWCEKPMPIQLDFILRRFVDMAEADPSLRELVEIVYLRRYGVPADHATVRRTLRASGLI
jgi:hypothetical protein